MQTLILTVLLALLFFVFLLIALSLPRFFGRKAERRCACSQSKIIMKEFENREKRARQAAKYRPESVDINDLPVINSED